MRRNLPPSLLILATAGCVNQNPAPPADGPKKAGTAPKSHEPSHEVVQAWAKAGGGYCARRVDKVGLTLYDPRDHPGDKEPAHHVAVQELPAFVFNAPPSQ